MDGGRLLSAVLAVVVCVPTGSAAEEAAVPGQWLQWRGPDRRDISPDKGLRKDWDADPPQLVWKAEGLGSGYAGISLGGGRIFSMGDVESQQVVVALDAQDGRLLWRTPISDKSAHSYPGARCTPTIDGQHLYVVGSNGDIACLQAQDGALVWQKNFQKEWDGRMMSGWGYAESPLVDGDRVICTPGGAKAMMVALDKRTGAQIWQSPADVPGDAGRDGAGYASSVISHGGGVKQYVQLTGRGLIGVRAADGKLLWSYNPIANTTANIPTPLIDGDHVFASTGYQTGAVLLRLSPDGRGGVTAREQYFLDAKTLQNHHGGMVLLGDFIYCGHGHNNGFPICVRMSTGKVVWGGDRRGPGSSSAAVTLADGHLVFRYQSGEVALIEATPQGYQLKGSFTPDYVSEPSWAHPVVIGGKLYLREQDQLMCYDVRQRS